MILNPVLAGAGISQEELQAYLDGAHIEFAATQGDNTLHLRTRTAGYDCTIHWGDGSETVAPANGGNIVHNYAEAKTYHIFITGKSFAGFYVNNQAGKEKYVAAHSMGKWEVDTASFFTACFYGCTGLTTLSADLFRYNAAAINFGSCFRDCDGLTTLPAGLFQYNTKATSFDGCFYYCTGLTTLPTDLFRYNTAATNFSSCFYYCMGLTTLPTDLFRYNTAATNFSSCFSGCMGLTTLPAGLFRYNTEATDFDGCFCDCTGLTTLPADLFRYNTEATDFRFCFGRCTKLTLRSDIFGTAYSTRFSGKTADFSRCFDRTSFSGTQGTAPALWSFTFGSVTSTGCFGGAGNSATSLSNYSSIPAAWK